MKFWRNVLLAVGLALVLNVCISIVIEVQAIKRETQDIQMIMKVAAQDAIGYYESENFGIDDHQNVVHVYDIKKDEKLLKKYNEYIDKLNAASMETDKVNENKIKKAISAMRNTLTDFLNGKEKNFLIPSNFGLSYLDVEDFSKIYSDVVNQIMSQNYSAAKQDGYILAFSGNNRAKVNSIKTELVAGPTFINMTKDLDKNSNEYLAIIEMFGVEDNGPLLSNNLSDWDVEGDRICASYVVQYTVEWTHETATPFFLVASNIVPASMKNERNHITIPMPKISFTKQYIKTN